MNDAKFFGVFRGIVLAALPASVALASASGCGGSVQDASAGPSCPAFDGGSPVCVQSWDVPTPVECLSLADPGFDGGSTTVPTDDCVRICGPSRPNCNAYRDDDGGLYVECPTLCTGRRPAGLLESCDGAPGLGPWLARLARLEAASVVAFRVLANELRTLGAPRALVRAARRAARDEVRHARAMTALARRHGAQPPRADVAAQPRRELEQLVLENAVEGCVRETYGALLATWQAHTARDPSIRATMLRIARDETRHAALAWRIARFGQVRLGREARERVASAQRRAVGAVEREGTVRVDSELARLAGLPDPETAQRLIDGLRASLWAAQRDAAQASTE